MTIPFRLLGASPLLSSSGWLMPAANDRATLKGIRIGGIVDCGCHRQPFAAPYLPVAMRPDKKWLIGFAIGLGLLVMLSVTQLRFTWWPTHPCIMFFWATNPGVRFAPPSFVLAVIIKALVIWYGGGQAS